MAERKNPYHKPGDCFTVVKCEKCGEFYEADFEHICKKKNSYKFDEKKHK